MHKKMTLEEFIKHADPIVDENFERNPMFPLWEKYMDDATVAYNHARKALKQGDYRSAYWNALNAIGCYAAAHAAVEKNDKITATAHATHTYLGAIAGARMEQPHLYKMYVGAKPRLSSPEDAARYKVKPKLRWEGQKLYCGDIVLAEAFHDRPENSSGTFEFDDLVCDYYGRDFVEYWKSEFLKGKSIETVLEELYTRGFEDLNILPDGNSWKHELSCCDDVFIDTGDNRQFLFGKAGEMFLSGRYIGRLYANERDEFCYDPLYFRQQVFMKSDGRLLQDGRLIVPAETNPRDVVEAIMQDVLSLLDVELVPR